MGGGQSKAIRKLEDTNNKNAALLEQVRVKHNYETQLVNERYQSTQATLNSQLQNASQRINETHLRYENEIERSQAAQKAADELQRQMERQAEVNREQLSQLQLSNQSMLRQQEESNQRQIQSIMNIHNQHQQTHQEEFASRQGDLNKQHREHITEMANRSQNQIDTQAVMFRNTLETHIEHSEKVSRQQNEQHLRHAQTLQESLEAERERSERLYEAQNQLIQQFLSAQEKFHEYVSKPPEKPIFKEKSIQEAIKNARLQIGLNDTGYYNFAFAGHTKAGKSSLINAIRGLRQKDDGAAAVDFTECTHDISFYTFPEGQFPFVRLYDLPGSGTLSHNSKTYYSDKGLCAFDCLIIMVQQTLCQEDITFALQALKYNQPVAFVRSRCDVDLDNAVKDELIDEINQDEITQYINNIAQKYKEQIDKSGDEALKRIPCYFVSAISMRKLVNGQTDLFYQEAKLLEYITLQSKHSRTVV